MRIVYIGAVDFSYYCLEEVLKNKGNVVGIATLRKAKNNSDYHDLTPLAKKYNIPIHYFDNVNDKETVEWIKQRRPDVIFCWGISQIIKSELLNLCSMGIVGVHPTLLPENRGRHPLIWALALGLKESGLTFFFMDESADSGPILSQKSFRIEDNDDASTLYEKIKKLASVQIKEFLPKLISGNYEVVEQDHQKANYWRKRSRRDGIIDWRMSCEAILNLVRALTKPYPGAEFKYRGQVITVWRAIKYNEVVPINLEPGKIIKLVNGLPVVKCYDGAVIITEFEPKVNFIEGDYME